MRVHYIQHVPFEGLGYIDRWIEAKGYSVSVSRMYEQYSFPDVDSIDVLIVMGGPMGVYDAQLYPWIEAEKRFVKKMIEARKIVVGICLGSQMIASALGARVYPNGQKEIGWLPVTFSDEEARNLFDTPELSPIVFQWHGDTFDLPAGSVLLASSSVCRHQAFLYGDTVLGLQFHFEVTEQSCISMLENGIDELIEADYVQDATFIKENTQHIAACNKMMESVLNKLIDRRLR